MASTAQIATTEGMYDDNKGHKDRAHDPEPPLVLRVLASDHPDATPLSYLWARLSGLVAGAARREQGDLMAKLGQWQRQMLTLLEAHGPQEGATLAYLATGNGDKRTRYLCTRALKQLRKRGLVAFGPGLSRQRYMLTAAGVERLEEDPRFARKERPTL
jgi:hypothetical protein